MIAVEDLVLRARDVTLRTANGTPLLDTVSLDLRRGEVVVIIGPSGSGKTTLLDALAGVRTPDAGSVRMEARAGTSAPPVVGYVPQDDIVHLDLAVESTLRYAARLRLASASAAEVDAAVEWTLDVLGLAAVRSRSVGSLSGGQRKRASIGSELVARPDICLLDEPTSGLDPASSTVLMRVLRDLADRDTAVVFTSHHIDDVNRADRVIVVAPGGRIAFDGAPEAALAHFGVSDLRDVCDLLDDVPPTTPAATPPAGTAPRQRGHGAARHGARAGVMRQWTTLARRNVDLAVRNRVSLAITAGSPVLVIAMFVVLFESGDFETSASTTGLAMTYWLAFAGFFFGLTFGLLQICTELAILRRERLATISTGPYLAAKCALLAPALVVVDAVMIATLTWLHRLPGLGAARTTELLLALVADSLAGLALGLLASAAVSTAAQAALALPMLCFPAVLFSGAVVPVRSMTGAGHAIGAVVSTRWAFEAVVRTMRLDGALARTSGGRDLLAHHGDAFVGSPGAPLAAVGALAVLFLIAAHAVVSHRSLSSGISGRGTARPRR